MTTQSKELTEIDLAKQFLMIIQHNNHSWFNSSQEKKEEWGLDYHLLDNLTQHFFSIISGHGGMLIDFCLIPMEAEKFPQNYKHQKQFQYNILPTLHDLFKKEYAQELKAFSHQKFIPIDYGYPEKIETGDASYNAILMRVIWQCIEYWSEQKDMSLEQKIICYEKDFMSILLGNHLIPENILVPLMRDNEREYNKSNAQTYTTTANWDLIYDNPDLLITGIEMEPLFAKYHPQLDIEKMYKENFLLEQSLQAKNETSMRIKI